MKEDEEIKVRDAGGKLRAACNDNCGAVMERAAEV